MRTLSVVIAMLALAAPTPAADPPVRHDGKLVFLGIAIDQAGVKPGKVSIDDFNYCAEDMEKVFQTQGRSLHQKVQASTLLGRKVTREAVLADLDKMAADVTGKDLAVVFIDSHGTTGPRKGWMISDADGKTILAKDLKDSLGKFPCHVLLLVETCTSGGLAVGHPKDIPLPPNVTIFCACKASQHVGNDLTESLLEGLYGWADLNHDGVVVEEELRRYVQRRYREWYPAAKEEDPLRPVITLAHGHAAPPLTHVSAQRCAVFHKPYWLGALMEKRAGNQVAVWYLGYDNKHPGPWHIRERVVPRDMVWLPGDPPPVNVRWKGDWYPARILSEHGDQFKIHYMGETANNDEVVGPNRVKFLFARDLEGKPEPRR